MDIEFLNKTRKRVSKNFFLPYVKSGEKIIFERIQRLCGKEKKLTLSLTLVNDDEMATINEKWRGKIGSTDVLSFSYVEKPSRFPFDGCVGDIIISVEKVEQQAPDKNHTFREELVVMFVHGFLHVFGFDHEADEEEAEMEYYSGKIRNLKF